MPKILATITHRLRTGQLGNKRAVSVAGVPAASINPNDPNFKASYAYVDLDIKLALAEDNSIWCCLSNGRVTQSGMINAGNAGFNPWYLHAMSYYVPFSLTIPVGNTTPDAYVSSQGKDFGRFEWWYGANSWNFTGNTSFSAHGDHLGEDVSAAQADGYSKLNYPLSSVQTEVDEATKTTYGIINILFPIVYVSTSGISDAITLNSQQIRVDMTEFLSYFPWAVSKEEWLSCNRKGGSVQRFSTGWQDAKNVSNSPTRSHVFDRQNDWRVSEKTGKE